MSKSFIFLSVSLVAESSSCQCLECAALKVLDWCFTSRFSEHLCLGFCMGCWLRSTNLQSTAVPACSLTYLVPQQSWERGYREYAFHNSFFLQRADFWLCTSCFTLNCGNLLIYCAHGVGLGKWNGGSEVW